MSKFQGSELEVKCSRECWNCGHKHEYYKRELCPAYGNTCTKCHKLNHFAVKCRGGKGTQHGIKAVDGTEDNTEIFQVSNFKFDESQFVTLELESGKYMCRQADTGAQCNVVPLEFYKKATNDRQLANVNPTRTRITAYGGTTVPVVGTVF